MADPLDALALEIDTLLATKNLSRYAVDVVSAKSWSWTELDYIGPDPEDDDQSSCRDPYFLLCTGEKVPVTTALWHTGTGAERVEIVCGLMPTGPGQRLERKLERYYTNGRIDRAKVEKALRTVENYFPDKKVTVTEFDIDHKVIQVTNAIEQLKGYSERAKEEAKKREDWQSTAVVPFSLRRIKKLERKLKDQKKALQEIAQQLINVANK